MSMLKGVIDKDGNKHGFGLNEIAVNFRIDDEGLTNSELCDF